MLAKKEQLDNAEKALDAFMEAKKNKVSPAVIEEKRIAYEEACKPFKELF